MTNNHIKPIFTTPFVDSVSKNQKNVLKITHIILVTIFVTFVFLRSAYSWPIPDTGPIKCYDIWLGLEENEVPCPKLGEPFYGQDPNYIINPPSYTKLDEKGNDLPENAESWVMVRDNVTGLIWEIKTPSDGKEDHSNPHDADNKYTWYDSNPETNGGNKGTAGDGTDTEDFINALNNKAFGGYTDWRIPDIYELGSIVDLSRSGIVFQKKMFPNNRNDYYWSSMTSAYTEYFAWRVSFVEGRYDMSYMKDTSLYARAVRGEQCRSYDQLVINDDRTVTDLSTGLMWNQKTHTIKSWFEAISVCEDSRFADFSDWRLPSREELRSIVSYHHDKPSINSEAFQDTILEFYWSSTSKTIGTFTARGIVFRNGNDFALDKDDEYYYCRAVRGGQNQLPGHLIILSPNQASSWKIANNMPIRWETSNIPGNVKISLSRLGGKDGTFETIVENTANDGEYDWNITGEPSINCMLKIVPLSDPDKDTQQGLFVIKEGNSSTDLEIKTIQSLSHQLNTPSSNTTIDISWEPPSDALVYFYILNNQNDYKISGSEQSTEIRAASIRKDIICDDISFYFHVAALGQNEIIGPTTTIGPFRIDNVAPLYCWVNAPTKTTTPSIDLTLTANGAYEMNISNESYGTGQWETYSTKKSWEISSYEGYYTIFVQFKDLAGNRTNCSTDILHIQETLDNPIPKNLISQSHVKGMCSEDNTIEISWSEPDISDREIKGYAVLWDSAPDTLPEMIINTTNKSHVSQELSDGYYYVHIRILDSNDVWSNKALHDGPYCIKTVTVVEDLVPTNLNCQSHTKGSCIANNTIEISWSDPDVTDRTIKGYSLLWDNMTDTLPEKIMNTTNTSHVSQALPDGNYYVHIRIVDSNNVWSNKALHDGPYCIKAPTTEIPTPQGLYISGTSSQKIELKWYLLGADYTYNVYKSDAENGFFIKCDPFNLTKPEFMDTEVTDGIVYWYRITAANSLGNESLFSNAVSAKTDPVVSAIRLIPDNYYMMQLSGLTATYHIQVDAIDYSDDVQLSVLNLHPLIDAHFNNQSIKPPAFVTLNLDISNTTPVNRYSFDVHALGKNRDDRITLFLDVEDPQDKDSVISAYLAKNQIYLNEPVEIYGSILPGGMNTPLSVHIKHESQVNPTIFQITTNQNKHYLYTYVPNKSGLYTIFATWAGNQEFNPDQSPSSRLNVLRGKSIVTCQTPDKELAPDDTVLVTGKLLKPIIANARIMLRIVNPDGVLEKIENRIFTETDGSFKYSVKLDKQGIWNINSCWQGNAQYQGVVSSPLRLYPGLKAGKILIVAGGGIADNNLWPTIQYLTTKFYKILLNRKFSQEMIYYMSPDVDHQDPEIMINDLTPTVADIESYIVSLYQGVSNPDVNSDKPLLIYMADHGGVETFKVNHGKQILKAQELDTWLDHLQTHTSCPVYLILEFCYSGSFVNVLAPEPGQKRVIITSTGHAVSFYDNTGRASFSQYLFNQLNSGYNLDHCFHRASAEIRNNYLFSNQIPQMFDGSNGSIAQTSYIGGSFLVGDILPDIISNTPNQTISTRSFELFVEISDVEGIDQVWASIIPPNMYLPETTQNFETPLINVPKVSLDHQGNGRYEFIYNGFTLNGIYRVTFYCEDTGGNVVSKETIINVAGGELYIPGDLDGNGRVQLHDAIIAIKKLAEMKYTVEESSKILCDGPCDIITLLQIIAGK
jgi:hypothetical protein